MPHLNRVCCHHRHPLCCSRCHPICMLPALQSPSWVCACVYVCVYMCMCWCGCMCVGACGCIMCVCGCVCACVPCCIRCVVYSVATEQMLYSLCASVFVVTVVTAMYIGHHGLHLLCQCLSSSSLLLYLGLCPIPCHVVKKEPEDRPLSDDNHQHMIRSIGAVESREYVHHCVIVKPSEVCHLG